MITLTEENYLKALYHLASPENTVSINEISRYLNVKMPSVNSMMKKFADKKWVIYESYKPIHITPEGRKGAANVVRKHRLTEMFLVGKMGFAWDEVHQIAEQVEHISSEAFFDKIDELLGHPKLDPHGSPIPDKNGKIIELNLLKISECKPGTTVIFSSLTESSDDFLKFLDNKKLKLNTEIKIISLEDFDKSMVIEFDGKQEVFSAVVTEHLLVKKQKTGA